MPEPDFSRLFISRLNRIGVNYFITGSSEVIDFSFLSDQMKPLGLEREWEKAKYFFTP